MSNLSKNTEQKYLLNGVEYNAPIDWEDVNIVADYSGDNVQPSLEVKDFQFTLEAREAIKEWIDQGMTGGVGIFEGMPFQLTLFNNTTVEENFKAYIDFTTGLVDLIDTGRLDVSLIKDEGIENFFDQIDSTTFGYLEEIGVVSASNYTTVNYVVEKKFNMIELLITSIILFIMIKELAEAIERTASIISAIAAFTSIPLGGIIGAAVYALAISLIQVAYTIVLLFAVIELTINLLNTLNPPKRQHKVIKMKTALELVCGHFGYSFDSPIPELDFLHYLPSNPRLDDKTLGGFISQTKGTPTGIPNVQDYGYNCGEMFDIAKKLFDAKIAIVNGVVVLRPENDPYWVQQSNWNLPDVLIEKIQYNTDDLKPSRLLSFETDLNDEWTIDNYDGTAFEIRTSPVTTIRDNAVLMKGLDEVRFNTAKPTRKKKLNAIESFLSTVVGVIDGLTGVLGGGTNFQSQITSKIGGIKQSENWHSVPKLLYLQNGKLPPNHRTLFRASNLYFSYHKEKSFVLDNYNAQKILVNDLEIPFGFSDYQTLTTNSYFYYNGNQAKITRFNWNVGQDTATISFWYKQPYTANLKETYIDPS